MKMKLACIMGVDYAELDLPEQSSLADRVPEELLLDLDEFRFVFK